MFCFCRYNLKLTSKSRDIVHVIEHKPLFWFLWITSHEIEWFCKHHVFVPHWQDSARLSAWVAVQNCKTVKESFLDKSPLFKQSCSNDTCLEDLRENKIISAQKVTQMFTKEPKLELNYRIIYSALFFPHLVFTTNDRKFHEDVSRLIWGFFFPPLFVVGHQTK